MQRCGLLMRHPSCCTNRNTHLCSIDLKTALLVCVNRAARAFMSSKVMSGRRVLSKRAS